MLPPEYYRYMDDSIKAIYVQMEQDLVADISRNIAKDVPMNSSTAYRTAQLKNFGYSDSQIEKAIAETSGKSREEVSRLMRESAYLNHYNDQILYKQGGKVLSMKQEQIERYVAQAIKSANGDISNLTRSLGVAVNGKSMPLTDFYRTELNGAMVKIGSGAYSRDQVVSQTIKKLADSGIRTIDYKSGKSDSLDVAVRRAVRTANSQITGQMSLMNADEMGQNLMEISSHFGARPDHAEWQGEVVAREGQVRGYLTLDDIAYGSGSGFQGWNCRHDWYPYFEGISTPARHEKEPEAVTVDGKEYSYYDATQRQRQLEREIRQSKREVTAYREAGLDEQAVIAKAKLKRQTKTYQDFSEKVDIRPKWDRTSVDGVKWKIPGNPGDRKPPIVSKDSAFGLRKPIRPPKNPLMSYENRQKQLSNYRAELKIYEEELQKRISANIAKERTIKSYDDLVAWGNEKGFVVRPEVSKIDPRAFDDYARVTDELMAKYPQVADVYKNKYEYWVSTTDDLGVFAEATGGFNFGTYSFLDYEEGVKGYLEAITTGAQVAGDGTIAGLYRHEFGHLLDNTIRSSNNVLKNVKLNEELAQLATQSGVSQYATTNASEMFAEGFAEYASGSTTDFAVGFGDLLARWLK